MLGLFYSFVCLVQGGFFHGRLKPSISAAGQKTFNRTFFLLLLMAATLAAGEVTRRGTLSEMEKITSLKQKQPNTVSKRRNSMGSSLKDNLNFQGRKFCFSFEGFQGSNIIFYLFVGERSNSYNFKMILIYFMFI